MNLDFNKGDGLLPVIVQHAETQQVLMLGYMNTEALAQTQATGKVTFYSRSKQRLWMKGEASGNILEVVEMREDCDNDALLIAAIPHGPTCHKGTASCFRTDERKGFVYQLEGLIAQRIEGGDASSYTSRLFQSGINKVAQKVGEEAVELVIEAKDNDPDRFVNEAADLLYHYLILLKAKGFGMRDVEAILAQRHAERRS
jgi:phosphoribosyl-ATP pyrophosphohydrolase/phosphoribosyl-AMP cyclohydrolase